MKKNLQNKSLIIFLGFIFLICVIPIIVLAVMSGQVSYTVSKNATTEAFQPRDPANSANFLTNQGTCFINNSGNDYFLPNKTNAEWDLFMTHMPTGVSLSSDCCVNGICYTPTEDYISCPSDCAWHCGDGIADIYGSGQYYKTVRIGTQCWMGENLNVGNQITDPAYANGADIKFCYGNSASNCVQYGGLYLWTSMVGSYSPGCPTGWHIPSDAEILTLTNYLGGTSVAGGKLKKTDFGGTDNYGFSAIGSGWRNASGGFEYQGTMTGFWSSTPQGTNAGGLTLTSNSVAVTTTAYSQSYAKPVRCVSNTPISGGYSIYYNAGPNGELSGNRNQSIPLGVQGETVTAVPNQGYRFSGWSDGYPSNPRTDTGTSQNREVTAYFIQ